MPDFVTVARLTDFDSPDEGLFVEAQGKQLALFRIGDRVYAIDEKCPHRAGPLSEGQIIGLEVRCPWHGARFSLETGKALCAPGYKDIRSYPVEVVGDEIRVDLA